MDVLLHSRLQGGTIRRFRNVSAGTANRMFDAHAKILLDPFASTYRVTLVDTMRGDYAVRDSDWEIHGIRGGSTAP